MYQHVVSTLRNIALELGEAYSDNTKLTLRQYAIDIYGHDAITAVAYCAMSAWCECRQSEYQFWSDLFNEMQRDVHLH